MMESERTFRLDEISIRTVIRDLFWNLPVILLAVLTAFMGVRIYQNVIWEPVYTSTATLAVTAKGSTGSSVYSSLTTASSMAEVYTEVFQSDVIREKIAEIAGEEAAAAVITSELIPETNLLLLHVTAKNPQSAYVVIQAVLDNYQDVSDYLFGNAVLEVMQEPKVSTSAANPFPRSRYTKMGMAGAVVLLACLIILCSVLRGTVKTRKAARRYLEGECLGVLPYEEKNPTLRAKLHNANKAVLLSNPVISFIYEESCHQLASRLDYKLTEHKGKTFLITSVAENEGKSTVALNLAAALSQRNKRVALVDMDFEKPALCKLLEQDAPEGTQLVDFLEGKATMRMIIHPDSRNQIYTILNTKRVSDPGVYMNNGRLRMLLAQLQKVFDYIVLDTAPAIAGTNTSYLQEYVDASVLVVRQDRVRISDLNDVIEELKEAPSWFAGYILNGFERSEAGGGRKGYGYGHYGRYGSYGKQTHAADKDTEGQQ